jgi:hypothetical protein
VSEQQPLILIALKDAATRFASFMGRVASAAGETILRFNVIVHAADSIARRYRWGISTAWPLNLIVALGEMADRNAPYHEFESVMLDHYSCDNWYEMERLVDGTCRYESVSKRRRKILRDTVADRLPARW